MDSSFERSTSGKDEWLTPPEIIKAVGPFDLDPCSPIKRPWDTAITHYNELDNGLMLPWVGRVWCNPPYGKETGYWLEKCAMHDNAIVLIFARTETNSFFNYIWNKATAVLFIKGRLNFYHVNGKKGGTAGSPSVLVAYGEDNAIRLSNCSIKGHYIKLR
jgi:hypothetical protein